MKSLARVNAETYFFKASGPEEHTGLWTYMPPTWMPNHTVRNLRPKSSSPQKTEEEKVPQGMP
jgi:hypothetical protein